MRQERLCNALASVNTEKVDVGHSEERSSGDKIRLSGFLRVLIMSWRPTSTMPPPPRSPHASNTITFSIIHHHQHVLRL